MTGLGAMLQLADSESQYPPRLHGGSPEILRLLCGDCYRATYDIEPIRIAGHRVAVEIKSRVKVRLQEGWQGARNAEAPQAR